MKLKRITGLILCLCMVLALLPITALAVNATSVWIWGVELTSANPYYHNGASGAAGTANSTAEGYNAYYNTSTGILYLNGLIVTDSTATTELTLAGESAPTTFAYAICADGDLTIYLSGVSVVSTADNAGNESSIIALGVNGNLIVLGTGTLTATAGSATDDIYAVSTGIYVDKTMTVYDSELTGIGSAATANYAESIGVNTETLLVEGGKVTGTGGAAAGGSGTGGGVDPYYGYSEGVFTSGLIVSDGTLTANGGTASGYVNESNGVYANSVAVSDGVLTAKGGTANSDDGNSIGISANTVSVSGGTVTADGGQAGSEDADSYGLRCSGTSVDPALEVTGGQFTSTGGAANDDSYGIYAFDGNIEVSGGELIAIGGTGDYRSHGVFAKDGVIRVSGGKFTAKTTDAAGTRFALNKPLVRGIGVTAQGSTSSDGSGPVAYADADNSTYLWVFVPNTPALTVEASPSSGVYVGGTVTLTATPTNIASPAYQWYSTTTDSTVTGALITGQISASFTPPTDAAGTMHYYCVETTGSTASNIVAVTVSYPPVYSDCTLTFAVNGGSAVPSISRAAGSRIDLSRYTPVREGYEFTGWYSDAELTQKITEVLLTNNATIYAGWKEKIDGSFENPFADVFETDWFYNDVAFVFQNGLMAGRSSAIFDPHGAATRGMIVAILYRLEKEPAITGVCPFDDVASGKYYEDAVIWASANNIVGGYGNNKFGPEDNITREQMASILYRYAAYKGYDVSKTTELDGYADAGSISSYALAPMKWANAIGIVSGDGERLMPMDSAERCQAAAILHKFCESTDK